MAPEPTSPTSFDVARSDDGRDVFSVSGDWTIWTIGTIDSRLRSVTLGEGAVLDVRGLRRIDTSGAYLIDRTMRSGGDVRPDITVLGAHPSAERLVEEVRRANPPAAPESAVRTGWVALLERAGRGAVDVWSEFIGILAFIGEAVAVLFGRLTNPRRLRWTSIVSHIEEIGLDALPIVCFLSFFIGLVVAFIGANLLAMFNASVFTVELVGIGMLREFGAVITGIILAGRTDSAFTAQIGAMKMRQEIDAMRVMGLEPMDALVAPRLIALLIVTPLLTFAAMMSGVGGGMIAAWAAMDISPRMFVERFQETIPAQHFWTGIVKTPVFALVIAIVGCRNGLLVDSDVTSLGRRTTSSVVQAIFMVITIDALFAVLYYLIDV
ncbi:MlaE family lipid ABC transporter permease subunit [bacterium]|nr:MlaE family lipid ABC transporter permease subunit [bacterium]